MSNRDALTRVLFILLVLAMYVGSLIYADSERERRSLLLREEVQENDQVHLSVRIVDANPAASEITARLGFRLSGKIAKDAVTPSADVRAGTRSRFEVEIICLHRH
jgi:Flp pilus assembly secretin CpaC